MSYRAQNLHAEIFLKVMWVLDRSKVPKVSKIKVYEGFLKVDFWDFMGGTPPMVTWPYLKTFINDLRLVWVLLGGYPPPKQPMRMAG